MNTKLIPLIILCLILEGLGLIAQSKDISDINCKDCCTDGNCQNGLGSWTYLNGDKYNGEWMDGKKNGEGTYTFANGEVFVGDFEEGKQNGEGTYTYLGGDKYKGEWNEGLKNGDGAYFYANGDKYIGEFLNGKQSGIGSYTYADGEKYSGEWKENKRNGQGLYTFANGKKLNGKWGNGKFLIANNIEKPVKKPKEWSAYQGYMNWEEAKAKCDSIGMKLPRRREWNSAYRAKIVESWKTDGTYYWTSDVYFEPYVYYFILENRNIYYFTKDVARHVRCIR